MNRIALFMTGENYPLAIFFDEEKALRYRDQAERFTHSHIHLVYDWHDDLDAEYKAGYDDGY